MSPRKVAAVPLVVIGGPLWLAVMLGIVAVDVYFTIEMIKAMFHGDLVAAFIGIPIVNGIAIMVASVLQIPGALLLAGAQSLWSKG
jgi:hypothetical protein